ncbi:MAG TPA: hypothetical protein VK922_11585 [Gemmatimonadaceae bacterium]|nr:hypothetical protein [Gemmatimonadaceae bacterium]
MIDRVTPAAIAAAVHLLLSALVVLWSVAMAGRILRRRDVSRTLILLTSVGGLLIAPAAFVQAMTGSVITGRALFAVAWLWPVASLVILAQAAYATARGFVARPIGALFIAYDLLVATLALVRYGMVLGGAPAEPLLALSAAEASALQIAAGAIVAGTPFALFPPVLAPALPPRTRGGAMLVRGAAAATILVWTILLLIALPAAWHAVRSFRGFARERLQERPAADLAIGVRVFPAVRGFGPPDVAVTRDVSLARELGLTALAVHLEPGAITEAGLDSVARAIEEPRRAGAALIAVLAVADERDPGGAFRTAWRDARLREMEMLVRLLRPEYVVPAAPADVPRRPRVAIEEWTAYLDAAARVAHRTRPRTRVMLPLAGFGARDSAIHAWAARDGSPIDAVGFRMTAGPYGGAGLAARLLAAERWIGAEGSGPREHWILQASGWPAVFGERNQERALWGTLTWASRHPSVRGVIVEAAGDYGATVGLRAVSGRIRPAGRRLASAVRALGEAAERPDAEPIR